MLTRSAVRKILRGVFIWMFIMAGTTFLAVAVPLLIRTCIQTEVYGLYESVMAGLIAAIVAGTTIGPAVGGTNAARALKMSILSRIVVGVTCGGGFGASGATILWFFWAGAEASAAMSEWGIFTFITSGFGIWVGALAGCASPFKRKEFQQTLTQQFEHNISQTEQRIRHEERVNIARQLVDVLDIETICQKTGLPRGAFEPDHESPESAREEYSTASQ